MDILNISNPHMWIVYFGAILLFAPFPPPLCIYGALAGPLLLQLSSLLEGTRRLDVATYRHPLRLLLENLKPDDLVYRSSASQDEVSHDYVKSESKTASMLGNALFILGAFYVFTASVNRNYQPTTWLLPLMYLALWLSASSLPLLKRSNRSRLRETLIWRSDQPCNEHNSITHYCDTSPYGYIVWQLPATIYHRIKSRDPINLLSCPSDAKQAPLASAITERRASLYLVSTDAVIPVCYNPEENEQAIEQLRTETFKRDIPVVTLDVNLMPVPASGVVLALWAVGLLVGFYFGLGQLYHLAHGNPLVTKQILPLLSFLGTWGVLEVYSLVLRRRGYARMHKAVGL